ncbi:glycosyltransferase family 39 protein [Nocardia sp. NPDC005978]|uniref:ArnT family glycosyltransferase n=1 Tax=Nocardia sp. NPDC005978 TaxID=3156725 RepID=UPI0033ACAC66
MTAVVGVEAEQRNSETPPFAVGAVGVITGLAAIAMFASIGRYGFFGDEWYFVAAGRRLAAGYADQGPLVPVIAWAMDGLAPGSLVALRVPAVLLTLIAIVASAQIAREFGGARGAQVLTAAAYATSPFLLVQGTQLATNTVDTALWVVISWLVVRWVRTRRDGLLLAAGAVTAVDMQVKWLIPFFWIAIAVAVLVYGPRELPKRPALWAGAAFAVVCTVPTLVWQARHEWPQLGMGAQVSAEQDTVGGRITFVPLALAAAGILGVVLLGFGLWALWRWEPLRPYRFLALTTVVLAVAFLAMNGRSYYVVGIYPAVMAAGAVWFTRDAATWRKWVGGVLVVISLVPVLFSLPWQAESDIEPAASDEAAGLALGLYGKFGWPELARATADAYTALPERERSSAVIIADSYWQASALDVQRAEYGLPAVYSPNRGFGYFGTPPDTATTVLWVGGDGSEPRTRCSSVTEVGRADARLGIPGVTSDVTLWRCDHPRAPWSREWPNMLRLG